MPDFGVEYVECAAGEYHVHYPRIGSGKLASEKGEYLLQLHKPLEVDMIGITVLFPLRCLLIKKGLLLSHAAALALGGEALLLVGWSGSGKTTVAALLAKSGWEILSDDHAILTSQSGDLVVLPFPEPFGLTNATKLLLGMSSAKSQSPTPFGKVYLEAEKFGRIATKPCPIRAIFFPKVNQARPTSVNPITKTDAMVRLLKANGMMLLSEDSIKKAVGIWQLAVNKAALYRLTSGSDLESLPHTLSELLNEAKNNPPKKEIRP